MASCQDLARPAFSEQPAAPSPYQHFVGALQRLAALFHDIGKATIAFQKKFANGGGAEAIRHDLMSFLVLAESLDQVSGSDRDWLTALANHPEVACSCVTNSAMLPAHSKWLARATDRLASEKGILLSRTELEQMAQTAPGLLSVLWLVLTHHRLPAGDDLAEQLDAGRHLNVPRDESAVPIASVAECLTPHPGRAPWKDAQWLVAVAKAAQDALVALDAIDADSVDSLPRFFWPQLSAHLLRPALILADHIGSMQADKGPTLKKALGSGEIYANLYSNGRAGDTLAKHLLRVEALSQKTLGLALGSVALPTATLPADSLALRTNLPADFRWQENLGDACAEARTHGPVFASIIAETGAGKTLAGTRAMHALSGGKLRFTLALGLRSLTWQSAGAMLDDAKIPAKDVTVAVGQPQTLGLDAQALANQQAAAGPRLGSESAHGSHLDAAVSNTDYDASWLEGICTPEEAASYWGKPALSVLSAPVVACTVDHLVSAVSLLRGGDAKLFLRLASADLLLDEIDAYSATDLQTIGKLTFVAGMHGRNVVLMSATLSPAIQQGLFAAWHAGLAIHARLQVQPLSFTALYSANCQNAVMQFSPSLAAANQGWEAFVRSVCAHYAGAVVDGKRRLALHSLVASQLEDAFCEMEGIALQLHDRHFTVDTRTGKRVSLGFVRLNTAKHAWKMAEFLAKRPAAAAGGPDIRFVAYHSKFPRNYLGVLDATLGQLTRRKSEHAFLETPALRAALDTTASDDVVVIVCTTTLIETGRDFDFDWCILEPRSVRGEVQAVGRVRRHRKGPPANPGANVVLLSKPLAALTTSRSGVWNRPGVEDALPGLRVTLQVPTVIQNLLGGAVAGTATPVSPARPVFSRPTRPGAAATVPVRTATEALPVAQWSTALDAQLCLETPAVYEKNRIGYLEQALQSINLSRAGSWNSGLGVPPSLAWYLSSYGPLNARHAVETRFRGEEAQTALFVPTASGVRFFDPASHGLLPARKAEAIAVPATRALVADLSAQALQIAANDPHIVGAALRCAPGAASFKELTWDPLLGFLEQAA